MFGVGAGIPRPIAWIIGRGGEYPPLQCLGASISYMFRKRVSECNRLMDESSLLRAAAVPLLLALCLITQSHAFPRQAREKERERRILEIQRLFTQGDLAGARKLLDEASKRFPADAGLDNLQGVIEAQE